MRMRGGRKEILFWGRIKVEGKIEIEGTDTLSGQSGIGAGAN